MRVVDAQEYLGVLSEMIEQGKQVSLTVTGGSMLPFIAHGRDRVVIEKPVRPWKKGDIAFFRRRNGAYVMHRIVRVDSKGYCWFIGDAQQVVEGPVLPEQIFGIVTAVNRKGKWEKPGTFWWEFFALIWIRIIPLRPYIRKVYSVFCRCREVILRKTNRD